MPDNVPKACRDEKCTLVHSHQKASCNYLNHGRELCNHFLSKLFCCLRKCCYICIVYPVNRLDSLICSLFSIQLGSQRTLPIISPPASDISSGRC
jgi:hypothetical protein